MKACFMGLGYIGLPTAIITAGSGIQVIGVDVNPKVVEMTNRGIIHIVEPGLQELCSKVMEFGKLKASDVPEESDVYLIVVPTPFKGNHEPDISYCRFIFFCKYRSTDANSQYTDACKKYCKLSLNQWSPPFRIFL